MKVINLSADNSLLNQYLKEIRSVEIQGDSMRFRRNLERMGEIAAYELSKTLVYQPENITTPLADTTVNTISEPIVVATILRAGLPFHQGFLSYFDSAENAFVSAYRLYSSETEFTIHTEYIASPDLTGKTLIICDPMLATGSSMEVAYKALLAKGQPAHVHFASVIATNQAIDFLQVRMPEDITLWTVAIDPILNEHKYIVPGLGDAGDLAFGEKL